MRGIFMRENREIPWLPVSDDERAGRAGKAEGRKLAMNGWGKSDGPVVPPKAPNKAGSLAAEALEGRGLAKGNTGRQNAFRTQRRVDAYSALDRVRQAARGDRKARFTALFHHVTIELLRQVFLRLRRKAAPGVDDVTWDQYSVELEENLQDLHERLHRGAYRAKPSRRVYIAKGDGRLRPLGIAALEDKIVQGAVVEVLNTIYEVDFLGFSYGFRQGRRQHDALDALATGILRKKVNWVLDADVRGYFDGISHQWLMRFLEHRVADRRILRLIRKWLSAGVMEHGSWVASGKGTPQGATISPLLANVFLHYVFDLWVQQWRNRNARGDMIVVRFADDTIVGFQHRDDAERFLRALRQRLGRFALELNPDKTRLLEFGRFAAENSRKRGRRKVETFDFLGFTHICGRTREGGFLLLRHAVQKRMRAKLSEVKAELMRRRHLPIPVQGDWLASVVRGHFAYYGVPTNIRAVDSFRTQVIRHWPPVSG